MVSKEAIAAFNEVCANVEADVTRVCMAEDNPVSMMGEDAQSMIESGMTYVTRMLRSALGFGVRCRGNRRG